MLDSLGAFNQPELLALALEAARRNDSANALALLKEAAARPDASAQALFMLGSEYAHLQMVAEAKVQMARAVAVAPDWLIARFQLGLLQLTSGDPEAARLSWAPLAGLGIDHPEYHLAAFHRGLLSLIADEFEAAEQALQQGLLLSQRNEPLNADMRRILDAIAHLPGRQAVAPPPVEDVKRPAAFGADLTGQLAEPNHLFINAYADRGKPH